MVVADTGLVYGDSEELDTGNVGFFMTPDDAEKKASERAGRGGGGGIRGRSAAAA